jgi:hypothetical protein
VRTHTTERPLHNRMQIVLSSAEANHKTTAYIDVCQCLAGLCKYVLYEYIYLVALLFRHLLKAAAPRASAYRYSSALSSSTTSSSTAISSLTISSDQCWLLLRCCSLSLFVVILYMHVRDEYTALVYRHNNISTTLKVTSKTAYYVTTSTTDLTSGHINAIQSQRCCRKARM